MQTPHPTSPGHRAASAQSQRGRRWNRLALAGTLVLLVLLTVAAPATALSTQ
jgi:hypothetical protein